MGFVKYHQELTDSEQPNQWGYAPESQFDQANHMRYYPEPQNELCHYPYGVWAYPQECEQSSERNLLPEPQKNSNTPYAIHPETSSLDTAFNKFMQDCPPMPQDDPYLDEFNNDSHCGWEDQNQKAFDSSYSPYQEPSSLEQIINSFMQNCPTSPPSFSLENSSSLDFSSTQNFPQDSYDSFHQPQNSFYYTENSPQQSQNSFHNSQHSFPYYSTSPQHIHAHKITLNLHPLS
ncbi:hypothetical protein AHAS_Ahas11G0173400 [Arachis hypogaea]